MSGNLSQIWEIPAPDAGRKLEEAIGRYGSPENNVDVFFRADDIGVPSENFKKLLSLFIKHGAPLALAVVPAWTSFTRWEIIKSMGAAEKGLWTWHQHGWRHVNHERHGKKQEFGPVRNQEEIQQDLLAGKIRLETILGDDFFSIFTPPWNRCNGITLDLIKQLSYHAVSRSQSCRPPAPKGLIELSINVDFHTRKPVDPGNAWVEFFHEIETSLGSGRCGIMIHHQRMNETAFDFLNTTLETLKRSRNIRLTSLPELIKNHTGVSSGLKDLETGNTDD